LRRNPPGLKLTFVNPAKQFDAGDPDRRGREPLEAEHWTDAQLHATVILFYQVIQVL
jgi:hypothetical protein